MEASYPIRVAVAGLAVAGACLVARPSAAGEGDGADQVPARYQAHARALVRLLPRQFTVVIEPPFVVVGDEAPEMVKRRSKRTVRWAVDKLKSGFFASEPREIIDIYLFRDDDSYRKHAKQLFGDTPSTPYGYYSSRHRAMIMNIGTGGGTLVHEIVHPFVEADFPDAPPWLNEGLGSLFEASHESRGQIRGLVNWRLPGLQRAIRDKEVPRFEKLFALNEDGFYGDDSGVYYAQSRYLLYYLQERGKLHELYRRMRATRRIDPTGYKSLIAVLGDGDMDAFQERWSRWVLGLRWRR